MNKYRIIGNMTGNSMDAIDLVLTEFNGDKIQDICTYTKPYNKKMQEKIENLRSLVHNKTRAEIENIPNFKTIHDEYIKQIAKCINNMLEENRIDKKSINAIGFHGKTLDHNPPSKTKNDNTQPYTLQIGSGQMLANLTQIPVIYDFRSAYIMAGFDGAPLVPPHNAHISLNEGDGIYYNGGNTSNFAIINNGVAQIAADAGPFNEYIDNYIRLNTSKAYDKDGVFGKKGSLDHELLQVLFNFGKQYYELPLPKSGDPAYYHKEEIFKYIKDKNIKFENVIYTLEYFSAYIAIQALTLIPSKIKIPSKIILFGGGWKNPIVRESFEAILSGKGYILPEHKEQFSKFIKNLNPTIINSKFGDYMEARLFADLARYKLENKMWEIPEIVQAKKNIISGQIAYPQKNQKRYNDRICLAAKGWQQELHKIHFATKEKNKSSQM